MFKLGKKISVQILDENIQDFRMVKRAGDIDSNPENCGIFLAFIERYEHFLNTTLLKEFAYEFTNSIDICRFEKASSIQAMLEDGFGRKYRHLGRERKH